MLIDYYGIQCRFVISLYRHFVFYYIAKEVKLYSKYSLTKNKMKTSLLNEIKAAIQIALFKHKDMHHVSSDRSKTLYAFYIIIIAAVLGLIGQQFFMGPFKPSLGAGIGMAIFQIIMVIIGIYVLSAIAKSIFKGSAKHDEFFRVLAYAMIVSWLSIIPALGLVAAIWGLILLFVILKVIHKLTTGGAIGTIIVGIIVMGLISMILSPVFGKMGFGYSMKGGYKFKGPDGSTGMFDYMDKDSFKFNVETEDGGGTIEMDEGRMRIETEGGEVMEIEIPTME